MDYKWCRLLSKSLLCVSVIYFCRHSEGRVPSGLCEFEDTFPSPGKEMCFNGDVLEDEDEVSSCPLNMVWGNCTCMATCEDPKANISCYNRSCSGTEGCYCPSGFLMEGGNCIPLNQCRCFLQETEEVLPIYESYVRSDCSRRCICRNDVLVCMDEQGCSPNAICEIKNNISVCYCKLGFFGDGKRCNLVYATDCYDMFIAGFRTNGVYTIQPNGLLGISSFDVYCDMENGGGWTVIQRRIDGAVDFYRGWEDYKHGFGSFQHEFWLGNDNIASLTNQKNYQLRIDFLNSVGAYYYAAYTLFRVGREANNYTLDTIGSFSGNPGQDSLKFHVGHMFSTYDRDNDVAGVNCAQQHHGAWWYANCYGSNLNGDYYEVSRTSRIYWGGINRITYTEMRIRPTGES